jgi:tetratricopeptide (TPR) repeat protein
MKLTKLFLFAYFILPGSKLVAQTGKGVIAFYFVSEIAIDSKGNLFVTGANNKIIKFTPDGKGQDFAGSPHGYSSLKDGRGTDAMFNATRGLAIDKDDNIYVADWSTIRKVTPDGVVTTIYGSNKVAVSDGDRRSATFRRPEFIAIDNSGIMYVTDQIFDSTDQRAYNIIRKITPDGKVTTIKNADGTPYRAAWIYGLACDQQRNLYLSATDWSSTIEKITPEGNIVTVAGRYDHKHRVPFRVGDVNDARFTVPHGIAISSNGDIYFSESWEHRIIKISNNKAMIVAGAAGGGYADGKATQALLLNPHGIAFDRSGNLYIVDDAGNANSCIRKLSPDGFVTTFYKYYWNEKTKQYELTEPPVVNSKTNKQVETDPALAKLQKQMDSVMNDPYLKKIIRDAKSLNTDSIIKAAQDVAKKDPRREDTSSYTLPGKNIKALGAIPKKTLTTAELKTYVAYLYQKLSPAFHSGYGTPLVNSNAYDANTISNASVIAAEQGLLDQAVLLALKAAEKSPDDPVVLNNTGAILKKGGLEIAAITILESASEKDPGNSTIQNNLGQSYLTLGDLETAEKYFQQSISTSTYHPLANSSLAVIYLKKGNNQAALKYTENSLRGGFTDRAWHLLGKLKPDAHLMDYFRHRYKQPVYFNEDKYRLPLQCENVKDIPAKRAEYEAYRNMVEKLKMQFDAFAREEMKTGTDSMIARAKRGKIYQPPFMELASAMMLDKKIQMDKDGWQEIARSQKKYHDQMDILKNEYNKKYHDANSCGAQLALANEYMEKMAVVTREYQKAYLLVYKDFYHDMAYWTFFSEPDGHLRKGSFYGLASSLLSVLLQVAETHFLDVTIDCSSNEKLKREADEIEIEGECPIGHDGFEIPFGIGKFNLSCEKVEFQFGELLVLNVSHKFGTGETIWAIGPGVTYSIIGHSHESLITVPQLKQGPIQGGFEAGIKGQLYFAFKDGALLDYGLAFTAELDLLGIAKEIRTGYTIGMNSGLQLEEGPLKNFIDWLMGPDGEAPQVNRNVRLYNPN